MPASSVASRAARRQVDVGLRLRGEREAPQPGRRACRDRSSTCCAATPRARPARPACHEGERDDDAPASPLASAAGCGADRAASGRDSPTRGPRACPRVLPLLPCHVTRTDRSARRGRRTPRSSSSPRRRPRAGSPCAAAAACRRAWCTISTTAVAMPLARELRAIGVDLDDALLERRRQRDRGVVGSSSTLSPAGTLSVPPSRRLQRTWYS